MPIEPRYSAFNLYKIKIAPINRHLANKTSIAVSLVGLYGYPFVERELRQRFFSATPKRLSLLRRIDTSQTDFVLDFAGVQDT